MGQNVHPVTDAAAKYMDDMAEWAVSNVVHLPVSIETAADIAITHRSLRLAGEIHAANRIDDNVGRFVGGLCYLGVYFPLLRQYVVLGYEYTPAQSIEDGDLCESVEIQEVWLRGVEIGQLCMQHIDEFEAAVFKSRNAGGAL